MRATHHSMSGHAGTFDCKYALAQAAGISSPCGKSILTRLHRLLGESRSKTLLCIKGCAPHLSADIAPELLRGIRKCTSAVDIYSFGVSNAARCAAS